MIIYPLNLFTNKDLNVYKQTLLNILIFICVYKILILQCLKINFQFEINILHIAL